MKDYRTIIEEKKATLAIIGDCIDWLTEQKTWAEPSTWDSENQKFIPKASEDWDTTETAKMNAYDDLIETIAKLIK